MKKINAYLAFFVLILSGCDQKPSSEFSKDKDLIECPLMASSKNGDHSMDFGEKSQYITLETIASEKCPFVEYNGKWISLIEVEYQDSYGKTIEPKPVERAKGYDTENSLVGWRIHVDTTMIENDLTAKKIDPGKASYVSFYWVRTPKEKSEKCRIIKDDKNAITAFECQ